MKQLFSNQPALKIAAAYLVFGVTWIMLSDHLLAYLAGDNGEIIKDVQTVKGLLFVLLSGALIYLLSRLFLKENEDALQRTNALYQQYKALYETVGEGVVDYDFTTDTATINEILAEQLGLEETSVKGFLAGHYSRIHPEDLPGLLKKTGEVYQSGQNSWQSEYRYRMKDGLYHQVISRGFLFRHPQTGEVHRYIGTFSDISELRTLKSQYLALEAHHRRQEGRIILEVQEQERNRWALELHDNVCQLLTVVKLYLEQAALENKGPLLQKSSKIVVDVLNEIRQLSFTMKPPQFQSSSLSEAMEQLVTHMHYAGKLQILTDFNGLSEEALEDSHRLLVYRVVQEQLQNIVKHAGARQVRIRLHNNRESMHILVKDDGRGFDKSSQQHGIGLRNMRNRLEAFAGHMQIHTAPGEGCRMEAVFHLN